MSLSGRDPGGSGRMARLVLPQRGSMLLRSGAAGSFGPRRVPGRQRRPRRRRWTAWVAALASGIVRPGPLAQLAEQRAFNPLVVGSSPTGPTVKLQGDNPPAPPASGPSHRFAKCPCRPTPVGSRGQRRGRRHGRRRHGRRRQHSTGDPHTRPSNVALVRLTRRFDWPRTEDGMDTMDRAPKPAALGAMPEAVRDEAEDGSRVSPVLDRVRRPGSGEL